MERKRLKLEIDEAIGNDYRDENSILELLKDERNRTSVLKEKQNNNIYIFHKLFSLLTDISKIEFIKDYLRNNVNQFLLDNHKKTWLHYAVENNCNISVWKYLIEDLKIDIMSKDNCDLTPLHIACQKAKLTKEKWMLLLRKPDDLLKYTCDGKSSLEFACFNINNLENLIKIDNYTDQNLSKLLENVDNISKNIPEIPRSYYYTKSKSKKTWLNLLEYDDKYRLQFIMKDDIGFKSKFYLESTDIREIINECKENGKGILDYTKTICRSNSEDFAKILFTKLTKLKIKKIESDEKKDNVYYKSGLFLVLVTGRLDLVPSLLMFCQFRIILYGLLTCLICENLSLEKCFPEQVKKNLNNIKQFCENYVTIVLNKTEIRDLTVDKKIVFEYLNQSERLLKQSTIEIAFLGKCKRFLNLPSCQKSLKQLWTQKTKQCPAVKFCIHSIFHLIFLMMFSYVLLYNFYFNISIVEILCYIYGLGYLVEEILQIIKFRKMKIFDSYKKDATNYLDFGGLLFLISGFITRITTDRGRFKKFGKFRLQKESLDNSLNIARVILCISLILFFMRVLYLGFIFKSLGPKLKMISKMAVKDLLPLTFIFLIFIFSFGIVFQSVLFPNCMYILKFNQTLDEKSVFFIIQEIFRRASFTIFDSRYTIEELEDQNNLYVINDLNKIIIYCLTIIYAIVVNVMLMNLLIALFSYTVTVIIQQTKESWKANKYGDIQEYFYRSISPPPINIIEMIVLLIIKHKTKNETEEKLHKPNEPIRLLSFKILQAFALKDCRFNLLKTSEDKENDNENEMNYLKKSIKDIQFKVKEIEKELVKK